MGVGTYGAGRRRLGFCAWSAAWTVLLTACGTGGVDDGSGDGGGNPTPGNGDVATATYSSIPNANVAGNFVAHESFRVTNRGAYVLVFSDDGSSSSVSKLHGNPVFGDWSTANFGEFVESITPVSRSNESDGELSFYWSATDMDSSDRLWGMYNANNGSPSFEHPDSLGIVLTAPPSPGSGTGLSWVLSVSDVAGSDFGLRQEDRTRTGSNDTTDIFGPQIDPGLDYVAASQAVLEVHGQTDQLFVGAGSKLYRYSSSQLEGSIDLSPLGDGPVNRLIWHDGDLWVGYGADVLRYRNGTISVVTTIESDTLNPLVGNFCLNGGDIMMSNGYAYDILTGQTTSFIQSGNLDSSQQAQAAQMRTLLSSGIMDCEPGSLARAVYVLNLLDKRVYMIDAL